MAQGRSSQSLDGEGDADDSPVKIPNHIGSDQHPVLGLDHTGIVVPDLEEAIEFYRQAFGAKVMLREAETAVNATALGIEDDPVRLQGALLQVGSGVLELHEYLTPTREGKRRTNDTGIGHIAFKVSDIDRACVHLRRHNVNFLSAPQLIRSGELAGRRWVYARDPWGNIIELCQHPTSIREQDTPS